MKLKRNYLNKIEIRKSFLKKFLAKKSWHTFPENSEVPFGEVSGKA